MHPDVSLPQHRVSLSIVSHAAPCLTGSLSQMSHSASCLTGSAKWSAWKACESMSKLEAMIAYCELISSFDSDWEASAADLASLSGIIHLQLQLDSHQFLQCVMADFCATLRHCSVCSIVRIDNTACHLHSSSCCFAMVMLVMVMLVMVVLVMVMLVGFRRSSNVPRHSDVPRNADVPRHSDVSL